MPSVLYQIIVSYLESYKILSELYEAGLFVSFKGLSVRCPNGISDHDIIILKDVRKINLSCCYFITDTGLYYLRNVEEINLSYCREITLEVSLI